MKLKLVSCEIFFREMSAVAARSPNHISVEFLPKGLHDMPAGDMLARVQAAVDRAGTGYDAVLLGYGLCNNGLAGLQARGTQLIVPRAHDCITLFFGSKERYTEYFFSHPGTYFKTTGWIERGEADGELKQLTIPHQMGMDKTLAQYIEEYGEDNGRFLYETLCETSRNYGQFTFIEMGVEPDGSFEARTREDAASRGWKFEKVPGTLSLIEDLLNGNWHTDAFLVVPPGGKVVPSNDESILRID